jgi:hypothetical protein
MTSSASQPNKANAITAVKRLISNNEPVNVPFRFSDTLEAYIHATLRTSPHARKIADCGAILNLAAGQLKPLPASPQRHLQQFAPAAEGRLQQ